MKNLINVLIIIFICNFTYSQSNKKYPSVIVVNKDSLVCFTIEQSKQMAIWNEQRKECLELQVEDKKIIEEFIKLKQTQFGIISNLENETILLKKTIKDKDNLLRVCEDEKVVLNREIRKQKTGKWIAILGGSGLFILTLLSTN
jgi:hypothetical protein